MAYTSPSTINGSNIGNFFVYINEVTSNWFSNMLMIAIFVIFLAGYMRGKPDDFLGAFAVASYVTLVVGTLFWIIGLVTGLAFGFAVGLTLISSLLLWLDRKD